MNGFRGFEKSGDATADPEILMINYESMMGAWMVNKQQKHPWHSLLAHWGELPQWVAVFDITDAMSQINFINPEMFKDQSLGVRSSLNEKFCLGVQLVDASQSFRQGAETSPSEDLSQKIQKLLCSATGSSREEFAETLARGQVGKSVPLVTGEARAREWVFEFSQFARVDHRQFALCFVKETIMDCSRKLEPAKGETLDNLNAEACYRESLLAEASRMIALAKATTEVIHEINNPMSVIGGRAEKILQLFDENPININDLKECAEKILSMTERTRRIIKSTKGRTRKGLMDAPAVFPVNDLLDEVRELVGYVGQRSGVDLRILPLERGLQVQARRLSLSQVLVNLANNALEAVAGRKDGWAELSAEQLGPWIHFRMKDSGRGIPRETADRMFDCFFTTKSPEDGIGIGLDLSQQIVRESGGVLYYDPEEANTTFVVKIPVWSATNGQGEMGAGEEI